MLLKKIVPGQIVHQPTIFRIASFGFSTKSCPVALLDFLTGRKFKTIKKPLALDLLDPRASGSVLASKLDHKQLRKVPVPNHIFNGQQVV